MDANTLRALEESITHWEKNLVTSNPSEVRIGGAHCALCHMFVFDIGDTEMPCEKCPVYEVTNISGCVDTPYHEAHMAAIKWRTKSDAENSIELRDRFRHAAQAELDFLRSLRPTTTSVSED